MIKINKKNKNFLLNFFYFIIIISLSIPVYHLSYLFFSRNYKDTKEGGRISNYLVASYNRNEVNPNKEMSNLIEIENNPTTKSYSQSKISNRNLIFYSFFDSFASGHLVDLDKTNLHLDYFANAVMFPPVYEWKKVESNFVPQINYNDFIFNKFGEDELHDFKSKRCLKNDCLEFRQGRIFYKNKEIKYPLNLQNKKILLASVGVADDLWLLGVTTKDASGYNGFVYSFDGQSFNQILTQENIYSPYFGIFGFGGSKDDFLVIYGAYKGIAYRVKNQEVTDISRFFDFRVMDRGFHPEVIRAEKGRVSNWYVFSLTAGHPILFKLWPDENDEIKGEVFFQEILSSGAEKVFFSLLKSENNKISLLSKTDDIVGSELRIFEDFGFNITGPGELYFKPINLGREVQIRKIANSLLGSQNFPLSEASWLFSTNQRNWEVLPQGYYLDQDFSPEKSENFFLKVVFFPSRDKFYSPFMSEALFDFYY